MSKANSQASAPKNLWFFFVALVVAFFLVIWGVQQAKVNSLQQQIDALRATPTERFQQEKERITLEKERIALENSIYGTLVQALGGIALIVSLVFTWRNLKISEETAANTLRQSQDTLKLSQEGQVTDRFTKAIDQLGSDKLAVNIGGIYALERIAKDYPIYHWTIMEVLTSFVREKPSLPPPQSITADVQAALTVIGNRDPSKDPELNVLDLRGASLGGAYLYRANLKEAYLSRADLSRAFLVGADLRGANLEGANLSGANLNGAKLGGAYIGGADLEGADLEGADLEGADRSIAHLDPNLNPRQTNFSGAKNLTPEQVSSMKN